MINKLLFIYFLQIVYTFDITNINLISNSIPRLYVGTASTKNLAFFAGGINSEDQVSNIIDIYNSDTNQWSNIFLPRNVYYLMGSSIEKENIVLFAGGVSGPNICSNYIDIFNISSNKWTTTNLTEGKFFDYSKAPSLSGLVFFPGGYDCMGNTINSVDIYEHKSGNIIKKYFPMTVLEVKGESISEQLVAFACVNDTNTFVLLFNSTSFNWIYIKEIKYRFEFSVIGIPEYGLFMIAGGKNSIEYSNRIDIYDLKNNSWSNATLLNGRTFIGTASINDKNLVYFAGGIFRSKNGILEYSNVVDILNFTSFEIKQNFIQFGRYNLQGISFQNLDFTLFFSGFPLTQQALAFSYCPAGSSGPVNGFCSTCSKGNYAFFGSIQCNICPPGNYCPTQGTEFPIESPEGWYIPFTGSSQGLFSMCLPGFYCPAGSSEPIPCPAGTYCDLPMLGKPIKCPRGTYNGLIQKQLLFNCLICPAGSYCNKEIGATNFIPCPPGKYCPQGSINFNISCPQGNYCPLGTNDYIICPKGSYCPEGSSIPMACLSGYYCPEGSSTQIQCPGGYQCPSSSFEPTICKAGFYSEQGTGICDRCPQGQYNHKPGLSYCKVCEANLFNIITVWDCMKESERTVFILSWIVTIISGIFTSKGIYRYLKRRYERLKYNNIPITVKNFVFIGKALRNFKKNSITLMTRDKESPLLPSDNLVINKDGKINWDS